MTRGLEHLSHEERHSMNSAAPCYTLLRKVGGRESSLFSTGQ